MKQGKDSKGRFVSNKVKKELVEIELTDFEFIEKVKSEIYALYFDADRIKKAYYLITGIEQANMPVMKRTVLAYSKN